VELPRARLERRVSNLDACISHRFNGLTSSGRLLNSFLLSLWNEGDHLCEDSLWRTGVTEILIELVAMALRGEAETKQPADHRAMTRLLALIEDRLADPDLGPITLAAELRISVRSLQKLLAAKNTTPSAYIMSRRLARAADLLLCEPHRSITQIAFSLGFNDSAYFCRCFRRSLGLTPSAYRANGMPSSLA
jgi:AraC-like DNA-binding protein